jgi:hypothetical protein
MISDSAEDGRTSPIIKLFLGILEVVNYNETTWEDPQSGKVYFTGTLYPNVVSS